MSKQTRESFEAAMAALGARARQNPNTEVGESRFTDDGGRPYLYGTMRATCAIADAPQVLAELGGVACEHDAYLTMSICRGKAMIALAVSRWLDDDDLPKLRSFVCSVCGLGLSQHPLEACGGVIA